MNTRAKFVGGLRAQFIVALCLLLSAGLGLTGVAFKSALSQTTRAEGLNQAKQLTSILVALNASDFEKAIQGVDAVYVSRVKGDAAEYWGDESLRGLIENELAQGAVGFMVDGRSYVSSTQASQAGDVTIVLELGSSEARSRNVRMFWMFFLITAIVLLAFAYAFFTFFVVRPIRAIGVASTRASNGDLASPIQVLPANEFGDVGESFNRMLGRLEKQRVSLEERLAELTAANAQLKEAQDSLIRSEKLASVGELSAGIAHEIGNPLAAIMGFNEILRDGGLSSEEVDDLQERTSVQLERIHEIIRNLLDFSRVDTAGRTPTSIAECVRGAVQLVRGIPRARGTEIRMAPIDDDVCASVVGSQLIQVLVNLLLNAVDALVDQDDGLIEIGLRQSADRLVVSVADNGTGVPACVSSRIFDPFFTTKDPGKGTGLGLSISLGIMQSFGGDIQVVSSPSGTTFELSLPVLP